MHIYNMVQRIKEIFTSNLYLLGLGGLLTVAGAFVSCKDYEEADSATFLEGESKTPIAVQTNLSTAPRSRAFDKTFEKNDLLFAYIEAGKTVGGTFTYEEQFRWANFFTMGETVDNGGTPAGTGLITTSDKLSPVLYWDDFSSTDYDLRETGRGIRLKYGYCYNGGDETNASDKNETEGTLTWTVLSDQSAANGSAMKKSDLLYAKTQNMITYGHNPESRDTLVLPYTHAMSKITINVTTGEGYATDKANFASSVLTLKNMQIKADVNAPADTVTAVSPAGTADITTFTKSKENTTATYQAIVGPTYLAAGNILAAITNIDGNNYDIPLTEGILTAWSAEDKLVVTEEVIDNGVAQAKPMSRATIDGGKAYLTKPGIHYILDVTVDKQKITIRATITDWESVKADGKAAINFAGDVTEKGTIADELKANGFDVYKSSTNSGFSTKSTTLSYADGKWTYDPVIYWAGQSDNSFFRALSPAATTAGSISQGTDVLWGTSGDAAIAPRTGDVALDFIHAMSKITVNLKTSDNEAAKVALEGAEISISNLSTSGSINLVDGKITPATAITAGIPSTVAPISDYPVIPQTLTVASVITIKLADGTTYSLKLTDCKDADDNNVTTWTSGKSYTYTIHLEKEKITFRALVKNWDNATGSGNATLEWD